MEGVTRFPGRVELCSDNPMIALKDEPNGSFLTMACFFRVFHSRYGRGNALVLLQSPNEMKGPNDDGWNACLTDNELLARYLVSEFVSKFPSYRGLPAMTDLAFRTLDEVRPLGDTLTEYRETIKSGPDVVELAWGEIDEPFWFAYHPERTATGQHYMLSLIHSARVGTVTVNGRRLPGELVPRDYAGTPVTSAILAFAENWIQSDG